MFGVNKKPWDDEENIDAIQSSLSGGGFGSDASQQQARMLAEQNSGLLDNAESQQQIASSIPGSGVENVDLGEFDVGGLLSDFGKAFGDDGGAASSAAPMKVQPLQWGSGRQVQALPEYKAPTPLSTAADAIAQASRMYAGQPAQQPVQQPQQQSLLQKMLFGA